MLNDVVSLYFVQLTSKLLMFATRSIKSLVVVSWWSESLNKCHRFAYLGAVRKWRSQWKKTTFSRLIPVTCANILDVGRSFRMTWHLYGNKMLTVGKKVWTRILKSKFRSCIAVNQKCIKNFACCSQRQFDRRRRHQLITRFQTKVVVVNWQRVGKSTVPSWQPLKA